MGISFGGLGVLFSHHKPLADWSSYVIPGQVEIRSMFFATVSLIVLLLLAYLTNPSESSFRTYLTEQSFRQHLSRLNDSSDDDRFDAQDNVGVHYTLSRRKSATRRQQGVETSPVVFSTGAKVSLRTPKHVFHNFGILTVAAVVPLGTKPANAVNERSSRSEDFSGSAVWDTWFIGAFGRWWRGGTIESWWHDTLVATKDEEGCRSGLFDIKASDPSDQYAGLPYATSPPPPRSPPRLRQRERSAQLPARSSTPPPLPKSASLPLHNPDYRQTNGDRTPVQQCIQSYQPAVPSEQGPVRILSSNPSSLAIFDQSPAIADILRQIESSKAAVDEAKGQLADLQNSASQSHAALQADLDEHRERKRQEDVSKTELKSRTKHLEDLKRTADSSKREAEKRLRAAQASRQSAIQRVSYLDKEIAGLQARMVADEEAIVKSRQSVVEMEKEAGETLEGKKKEIKVAEDVIAALNARTKELEEMIAQEKERLQRAKDQAEIRKQDRTFIPLHVVNMEPEPAPWPPIYCGPQEAPVPGAGEYDVPQPPSVAHPSPEVRHDQGSSEHSQGSADSDSSKPARLSLAGISNLTSSSDNSNQLALRAKGYSIFDDDIASLTQPHHQTSFAPFDADLPSPALSISPGSATLIPNSLVQSIETSADNIPVSDNTDAYLDREWAPMQRASYGGLTTSPTSLTGGAYSDEHDPFEVRPPPRERYLPIQPGSEHLDIPFPSRSRTDPSSDWQPESEAQQQTDRPSAPRRWFSVTSKDQPKKGLNPDAKAFNFGRKKSFGPIGSRPSPAGALPTPPASFNFDPLSPSGLVSSGMPATPLTGNSLFSSMSIRAFAPSPEEREALQRALGGSTNTSLERLPSLADVGTLPPSPPHVHGVASQFPKAPLMDGIPAGMPRRSWFPALPLGRKPKFSPWDDEEPSGEKSGMEDKNEPSAL
ncbi:hypothetical protein GLOTRDRAFT_137430 [Gloeophyllum trabeum ATCC 11539]|uniref:Uncharacterized protein n=1 Tax=Gloeophyllum trabeum (strain ATCC 11539 / FP-39264 / Madison 617) TaxID=670483 RepID=S7RUV5_GLOTA|nr:uncharacterized protein GLOTRDRAFT_137430 [Gloeophyllum trabeum ATCC 11539]EPQ56979.1 hypothetical protein GLOTRDRAFT_137430 [Gloeophyllum trabeum ATCC 11539]